MAFKALPEASVNKLAAKLHELGFEIHSSTTLGIHFTAEKKQFEETFNCKADAEGKTLLSEPQLPSALQVPDAAVYLPRKPMRF